MDRANRSTADRPETTRGRDDDRPRKGGQDARSAPPSAGGPIEAFTELVNAMAAGDYGRAHKARQELRRLGFLVMPVSRRGR